MKLRTLIILLFLISTSVNLACSWFFKNYDDNWHDNQEDKSMRSTVGEDTVREAPPTGEYKLVPFEMKTVDDRFLVEAAMIKDLSPLDACHNRIMAELQGTCASLSEEEIAKLSVHLLNCQSAVEGRQTFRCTSDMTIGECTSEMDSTIWNSYQIVSNRARAVCYSVRQQQFTMKTEITVNKLVQTSEDQLKNLKEMKEGQEKLQSIAEGTFQKLDEGQERLVMKQLELSEAQASVESNIAKNIEQLMQEKMLIAAGNRELMKMTEMIHEKLDNATNQLNAQTKAQLSQHNELLSDLAQIHESAENISTTLTSSTINVQQFYQQTSEHQDKMIENLKTINSTINFVIAVVTEMRTSFENQLCWLAQALGGTGNDVSNLWTVLLHTLYFFTVTILLAIVNVPTWKRLLALALIPVNAYAEINYHTSYSYSNITLFIILSVVGTTMVAHLTCSLLSKKSDVKAGDSLCLVQPQSSLNEKRINRCGLSGSEIQQVIQVLEKLRNEVPVVKETKDEECDRAETEFMLPQDSEQLSNTPRMIERHFSFPTPHDPPPTPCSEEVDCTILPADQPCLTVQDVKRHLMRDFERGFTSSRRSSRSCSPARSCTSTSTTRRSISRCDTLNRSMQRQLCMAVTKAGAPCKLPCQEDSSFCYRHYASL